MARERAADVLREYQAAFPSAMRSFSDDLEACLTHLRCPLAHHKAIRTTNLLERAFVESRRRTKVIPPSSPSQRVSNWSSQLFGRPASVGGAWR